MNSRNPTNPRNPINPRNRVNSIDFFMADGIQYIGRFLIILGILLTVAGGLLLFTGKISWLGKLPGDIIIQRKNFTFYFPLATSILLSLILTFIFWLMSRR